MSCNYKKGLISAGTAGKIEFFDGATDPCGWDSGEPAECVTQPLPEVMRRGRRGCRTGSKVAVVVDRLEGLVLHQDATQLVRGLHTLANGECLHNQVTFAKFTLRESSVVTPPQLRDQSYFTELKPCSVF